MAIRSAAAFLVEVVAGITGDCMCALPADFVLGADGLIIFQFKNVSATIKKRRFDRVERPTIVGCATIDFCVNLK